MASGFLTNNRCYSSLAEADAAYWSGIPASVQAGKLTLVAYSSPSWLYRQYDTTGGAPSLVAQMVVPSVTYPVCDTMEAFNDGQSIGMGIFGVMLLAFLIRIQAWATR